MIGNHIYILLCEYGGMKKEIRSIHATFDGVRDVIDNLYEYYNEKGFIAKYGINGTLNVFTNLGALYRKFYVSDRTVEK